MAVRAGRLALKSKYGNQKVIYDGIKFDSKRECKRYRELQLLERAGRISDLRLQVPFVLAQRVKFSNALRATPAMKYVADFVYLDIDGKQVVEDSKGFKTKEYKQKRHLMLAYHGIEVREV